MPYNLFIFNKHHHKLSCKCKTYYKYCNSVYNLKDNSTPEAFTHPVILTGALILRHKCRHGMCYVLFGCICKIINPVYYRKCRCNRYSHSIDYCLYSKLAKLHCCLLHCRSPSIGYSLLKKTCIKYKPFFAKTQYRYLLLYIDYTEQTAQRLTEHGRYGTAVTSRLKHNNKEQISEYIKHRAYNKKIKRRVTVSKRS